MNRNDMYNYAIFLAVIGWLVVYRFFLQSYIDESMAGVISIVIIVVPILFLEVGIKLLVAEHPYIRAIVESPTYGTYTMRMFLDKYPETVGEHLNSANCTLKWSAKSLDFDKVDEVKLVYLGSWGDVFKFQRGRAAWMGYEVGHPQTEDVVLYTLLQNSAIVDHTNIIPTFFVKHATGHYRREMKLISHSIAKPKPKPDKPAEAKGEEKPEAE